MLMMTRGPRQPWVQASAILQAHVTFASIHEQGPRAVCRDVAVLDQECMAIVNRSLIHA